MKPKICRKEADKQLDLFKEVCGFEDAKAIATGGKETDFPAEAETRIIASIMMGRTEIVEGGKKLVHHLKNPVQDLASVEITPRVLKQHERRAAMEDASDEYQIGVKLLEYCAGLSEYQVSEMSATDAETLMSVTALLSFT